MTAPRTTGRAAARAGLAALLLLPEPLAQVLVLRVTLALPEALREQTAYLGLVADLHTALAHLKAAGYLTDLSAVLVAGAPAAGRTRGRT